MAAAACPAGSGGRHRPAHAGPARAGRGLLSRAPCRCCRRGRPAASSMSYATTLADVYDSVVAGAEWNTWRPRSPRCCRWWRSSSPRPSGGTVWANASKTGRRGKPSSSSAPCWRRPPPAEVTADHDAGQTPGPGASLIWRLVGRRHLRPANPPAARAAHRLTCRLRPSMSMSRPNSNRSSPAPVVRTWRSPGCAGSGRPAARS